MGGSPTLATVHWRVRTDTGTVAGTPTWGGNEDTQFWPGFDTPVRVRTCIQNTGTASGSWTAWSASRFGCTWDTTFNSTSDFIQSAATASSDADNTGVLTQKLTAGAGTFATTGLYDNNGTMSFAIANGNFVETETGMLFPSATCGAGEVYQLRTLGTGITYTQQPTFTTPEPAGSIFSPGNRVASGSNKTAGTSLVLTTAAAANAGNLLVVCVGLDNVSAGANGDENLVTSVTDSTGVNTWTKAKAFSNTQASAGAGACCEIWYSQLTSTIAAGGTITINHGSVTARAAIAKEFVIASGYNVSIAGTNTVASNNTSVSPTALDVTTSNIECLRVCASACEGPSGDFGPTTTRVSLPCSTGTNWALWWVSGNGAGAATTGGGSATNMGIMAESYIVTATGASSQIRMQAQTGSDWATCYVAFTATASFTGAQQPKRAVRNLFLAR